MEKILVKDIDKIDLNGKIIVFPTDTVYGVGCKIDDTCAIKKIYDLKKRDYSKPLAVLTCDKDVSLYAYNVSDDIKKLMDEYWPGALTIIFDKTDLINDLISAGTKSVGIRMPNSVIALKILKRFGPMCTTSINISGFDALNDLSKIEEEFKDKIDYLVIDDCTLSKCASTVVDARGKDKKILREGAIKL